LATRVTILSMNRIYALMAIGLILTINARGEQTISPEWLFVQTPLLWKPPPAKVGVEIRGTSAATVLVLYPNGKYAAVECLLIKQKDGTVTISNGDGQVIRIGTWSQNGIASLLAVSTVVFRTIAMMGMNQPEPTAVEEFAERQVNGVRELRVGPMSYQPLLQFSDADHLSTMIGTYKAERATPAASAAVPDAVTAVRLAEKALSKIYGKRQIESEKPFYARVSEGVWTVGGTLYCGRKHGYFDIGPCLGGVATAEIRQSDGHVLQVWHTK
jgi:hypothetical protein